MCCFFASLLFFGPRLAFLIFWLVPYGQLKISAAFGTFIWPFLGLIFLPWTTLMYAIVFPIASFDWIWLGLALFADIAGYAGSYMRRHDVPQYTGP